MPTVFNEELFMDSDTRSPIPQVREMVIDAQQMYISNLYAAAAAAVEAGKGCSNEREAEVLSTLAEQALTEAKRVHEACTALNKDYRESAAVN